MASIFEKFKQGLAKTREGLFGEITKLVKNKYTVDDELLEQIEEVLIGADLGVETSLSVIEQLQNHINKEGFNEPEELTAFLKSELIKHLTDSPGQENGTAATDFFNPTIKPFVVMVVGVNGTGKTTTIGKLAKIFHDSGQKVLLAAADTFRAAASEQLEIWAKRAGVDVVRTQTGGDPAAVAFDALKAA
ncbi:signal recognition particle receptor subunit alpha, partial [candidate division KSB1 bacterium]|nr:signal recognition particle receptor subunit alpha [candidate division KSB1 bacterium]